MTGSMGTGTGTGARERIEEVASRIVALRDAYYRGDPLVADAEYDAIEDELRALIAAHPELAPDPNPLERSARPRCCTRPSATAGRCCRWRRRPRPEQVAAFFDRFPGQPVVVMPKLDGLSLALVYEDGRLAARGHPRRRHDRRGRHPARTGAGRRRAAVDRRRRDGSRSAASCVMLRSTFAAYNAAHPDKPLINPRGAAAGTMRAKDPAAVAERRLRFFAFDLDTRRRRACRPRGCAAHARLRRGRHAPLRRRRRPRRRSIAAIEAERNDLDYDLDGAVLRLADRNAYAAAGTRSNRPRGALAFKFAAEEKTTVLADVVWDVGKIGKVAPVAVLEPVFVGGTTVTRATLANQEVIRARGVRIGDTVLVRRAGDVIPFVAGVLDASKRTGAEREIVPPSECPSCGQPLTEQGNSRELFCTNVACPAQTVRRLIHWALARRRRHRGDRPRVDRAPRRGRPAGAPVGLLRAQARRRCWASSGSARCPPTAWSSRSTAAGRSACAAR